MLTKSSKYADDYKDLSYTFLKRTLSFDKVLK